MPAPSQGTGTGPPRAPTMAAVARLAGVSQITVSRALNDPAKVSAATMARVREAVALTGYVPNLVAGALASRRSRLVAALMPSMTNPVYAGLVQRVAQPLREAGYQVLIGETGIAREDEDALVAAVLSRRPDGVVMIGIDRAAQARRMLIASGLPVIELWDVSATPIDVAIGFSHYAAGEAVAAFARERGRARAVVVTAMDERALRRRDAFQDAFRRLGGTLAGEACFAQGASFGRGARGAGAPARRRGTIPIASSARPTCWRTASSPRRASGISLFQAASASSDSAIRTSRPTPRRPSPRCGSTPPASAATPPRPCSPASKGRQVGLALSTSGSRSWPARVADPIHRREPSMRTDPVTEALIAGSVWSVPPLATRDDGALDHAANKALVRHIEAGGISTVLWGGNANVYGMDGASYAALIEAIPDWVAPGTWALPSAGPDFGKLRDQAAVLKGTRFPAALLLPYAGPRDPGGTEAAIRAFVDRAGMPAILYLRAADYLAPERIAALVEAGEVVALKYAVETGDLARDPYLDRILELVPRARIVSGIGEIAGIAHLRAFRLAGFTAGAVCIAPRRAMAILRALQAGDHARAESLADAIRPLERLRERHGPIPVIHDAVTRSGIAHMGPLGPHLSAVSQAVSDEIADAAQGLLAAESELAELRGAA